MGTVKWVCPDDENMRTIFFDSAKFDSDAIMVISGWDFPNQRTILTYLEQ